MEQVTQPVEAAQPLSQEQEPLWLADQLAPGGVGAQSWLLEIHGPLDPGALQAAAGAVVARHESCRTVFPAAAGRPTQLIRPAGEFACPVTDLSALPPGRRAARARRLAAEQAAAPFDLTGGPLARALLLRLGDAQHQLALALHPLICDPASLVQVVVPELAAVYRATTGAEPAALDSAPQYRDYVRWQQAPARQDAIRADLGFWRDYLAGAPGRSELPTNRSGPAEHSGPAAAHPFTLGRKVSAAVADLSLRAGLPVPMTLLAGIWALLYRYTGQEDVLAGLIVSRRDQEPWSRAVGWFDDTVALRADLSGEPSGRDLLRQASEAAEAVRAHGQVPFEQVVREVAAERSAARAPLAQVLLAVRPGPQLPPGWQLAPGDPAGGAAGIDLRVEVTGSAGELSGRMVYDRDRFSSDAIRRLAGHWRALLGGLAADPDRALAGLGLLDRGQQRRLLAWSTGRPAPDGPGLEEMIGRQAQERPDAVAVICGPEQLTYGELDRRSGQLAGYLRAQGIKPEAPVGTCLERSADHVVALLAILRAGGVYVPLDPEAPAERIRYMLADAQMQAVLMHPRLAAEAAGGAADLICLDDAAWSRISRHDPVGPDERPGDGELAYLIYTSGSTGRPKGVAVERGPLATHCRVMIGEYQLTRADRVLQFSQYSADASLEQILTALAAGATLIMRGPEIWSPRQLLAELTAHQVTVMNTSPAHWNQAVTEWARSGQDLACLALRLVILGGERVTARDVRQWLTLGLHGVRLLNAYGPTETVITATLADAGAEPDLVTIGRPLPGRIVHILDAAGAPVPAGVTGEVHIGGGLLARGYLGRPELTAERFGPDQLAARPGGRLYRTGDLARWLPDGRIDYVGRRDHQVKVRGYRIELGEVEAAVTGHPDVTEAVVIARGDGDERELVAYYLTRDGAPVAERDLRDFLAGLLPRHMQPGTLARLDQMPRLATGKPDRRGLPDVPRGAQDEQSCLPPRGLTEHLLAGIWAELLGQPAVGVRDNFFHLGGHSLLAAQMVDRIERAHGTRLALSTLFTKPTIEQLAAELDAGRGQAASRGDLVPVQAAGGRTPLFFLHGHWTGAAYYCFTLARACGPEQPFYTLGTCQFRAAEGAPGVAAIASSHLAAVRSVQPRGPYRLGGFCNGGLLAYEMAAQLQQQGEQVEFLGLVNPSPPVQAGRLQRACGLLAAAGRAAPGRAAGGYLRARHAQRHLYRLLRPSGARVRDFGLLLDIEPRLTAMFPPLDALYRDYIGVFSWSAASYRPAPYHGPVTFFWSAGEPGIARSWRPVIERMDPAGCRQLLVPGRHATSLTDHLGDLAQLLAGALSRAGSPAAGPPAGGSPRSAR